ncbi:MAG: MMPL family transporter [Deltaproteobacteria bacterium]|nr:MMPL family transporter [Deltaproteobacteria bacterium]
MPALENLASRIITYASRLAHHIYEHTVSYLAIVFLLTVASLFLMTRLELKSDFIELLPQNYQSVRDLRLIISKVGGIGHLSIAIESTDIKASQRFADDLAEILHRDYRDRIRYVDYKIDSITAFYKKYAGLFISLTDLKDIEQRLHEHIDREKRRHMPLFIDLLEDDEDYNEAQALNFDDIKAKYEKKQHGTKNYIDGYYTGEDGHLLAMLLKPQGGSTNVTAIARLLKDINVTIMGLNPKSYAPDLHYAFAGSYAMGLEEYETLKSDILGTAILCLSLIGLAIFIFFRRIRAVVLLGLSSIVAVCWTFAIAQLTIGYLNTVTAFLGAIVAGAGINYGIIFLARYFEELRLGHEIAASLSIAISKTIMSTFAAAVTTAVAFSVFGFSEVKSFSQFGLLGALGVLFMWIAAYTFLPAMIVLAERFWTSINKAKHQGLMSDELSLVFLHACWRRPRLVISLFAIAGIIAIIAFIHYLPNALEYDISRLRTKSSMNSGTAKLDERISKIFPRSMTPAALYVGSPERAAAVCKALLEHKKLAGDAAGIERCRSIYSFLPEQQPEKLAVIKDIRHLLTDSLIKTLAQEQQKEVRELRDSMPERVLGITDVPDEMAHYFTDTEGKIGTFVYVDPRAGRNLWNAKNLIRFTNDIRRITLSNGEIMTSSGEAVIFADLLNLLKRDSPRATLASFLGVFLVVLLMFRGFKPSIFVSLVLLSGTILMLGLMALLNIKLNFFNFMALPMTFGIGVDYSINLFQRYREEGRGHIDKALRRTGSAVFLCSLTTIIGYAVLIVGDSRALMSLGWLAILGEFTCITAAMIGMPALINYIETRVKIINDKE